jgi:lipopolysaccharide exporter
VSLAVKATRSAAWMLAAGLATRVVGLVGTLLLVRYVSPGEYGEAMAAAIVIGSAGAMSTLGVGPFVIVRARDRRDLAFHATAFQFVLGLVVLGLVLLFRHSLAGWFNTPGLVRYLPWMAVVMILDRLSFIPERVLVREMRFRTVAMTRSAAELSYSGVSLVTAMLGWGGMSVVAGNLARSSVKAVGTIASVDRRDWLEVSPLRRESLVGMIKFGAPLAVGYIAAYAASKWDNLLVSSFFGPAVMAAYNLAYNLAGMASGLVTDQVMDVLVPSFNQAEEQRRREGLLRGAALLALVATPLCIGLSAVSHTLVATLFSAKWAEVAPMLAVLSVGAMVGPIEAMLLTYLMACDRPRAMMIVNVFGLVAILVGVGTLGRISPLWACGGVSIAAFVLLVVTGYIVRSVDGVSVGRLLSTQIGPWVACLPMVGAVLGTRWLLSTAGIEVRFVNLALEIAVGGLAYVGGALLVARPVAREFLRLIQAAFARRATLRGAGAA